MPTFIQGVTANISTSGDVNLNITPTAGNALVAYLCTSNTDFSLATSHFTVSDGTNTWVKDANSITPGAGNNYCGFGYALAVAGSAVTVDFHCTEPCSMAMIVCEYSGLLAYDASTANSPQTFTSSPTTTTSTNLTPSQNGDLVVGGLWNYKSGYDLTSLSAGTNLSFMIREDNFDSTFGEEYAMEDAVDSSSSAVDAEFIAVVPGGSLSNAGYLSSAIAFTATPSGPPPGPGASGGQGWMTSGRIYVRR
jgi:hypothetical protein